MKKWHFKSSLSHSWIEWSRDGCNFLENVLFFASDNTVLWKNCAKNSTFVACFHILSANKSTKWHLLPARKYDRSMQGPWCTQLFWRTHYKWRTRFEWRTHRVDRTSLHYQPTPLVPRPRFGLRANPSSGYWEGGTLVWTLPKRTSPQPTRGDVQLKI